MRFITRPIKNKRNGQFNFSIPMRNIKPSIRKKLEQKQLFDIKMKFIKEMR